MKYLSYKTTKLSETERKIHNQKFIEEKLKEHEQYFDNMFKKIDENIKLDEEQRKIILTDEDYLMVIAGAGAGKTTTISAKVNYLIEKQNIKDNEIIVISFTNKAIEELKEKINKEFKHNVRIETFHKFGYEIIKQHTKRQPKIINDNEIIKQYIEKNIIEKKQELIKFYEFYTYYFELSEEIFFFKDIEKYNYYKNKQKFKTLKHKIEYADNPTENKTIKEEYTTNIIETKIANYLYTNNIEYKYKHPYKYDQNYIPDFTIIYNNKNYYIEQFNINKRNKYKYEKNINKIKKIHKKYKTEIIEIYEENEIEQLKQELKKHKIKETPKEIKTIIEQIIKYENTYQKFIVFCKTFISLFKSRGYEYKDFNKIKINNKRTQIFIEFIKGLYKYYEEQLQKNNQIDFDDMINKSSNIIEKEKEIKQTYKYIIIDEFQDISDNRFKLIKTIADKINSKIIVVGDDWQCIYGFTAANINLFTQFKNNVEYCEILKIKKTYRNSQQLIDIAGRFIQKNNNQIKKNLISNKKLKYPLTILKYNKNEITKKLIQTIQYLIEKYGEEKNILILGRYTFDINKIKENELIKIKENKIIYTNNKKMKIDFMTIHSSKGLGYDNVIIINTTNETLGFPTKIKTDPILDQLIKKETTIKYPEERRLFYVALTRTKNEVIILTPKYNESIFIKEIRKQKNIKIKSNIKYKK